MFEIVFLQINMSFAEGYNTRNRHNRRGQLNPANGARGGVVPSPINFNVPLNFGVPPPNFVARFIAPNPMNNLSHT